MTTTTPIGEICGGLIKTALREGNCPKHGPWSAEVRIDSKTGQVLELTSPSVRSAHTSVGRPKRHFVLSRLGASRRKSEPKPSASKPRSARRSSKSSCGRAPSRSNTKGRASPTSSSPTRRRPKPSVRRSFTRRTSSASAKLARGSSSTARRALERLTSPVRSFKRSRGRGSTWYMR